MGKRKRIDDYTVNGGVIKFHGPEYFRYRLVLATLTRRSIHIVEIRETEESPGIQSAEVSFLRLLDKITTGSHVEINETGTTLLYRPGFILGGKIDHEANVERNLIYYLQPIILLGLYAKEALHLTLRGVTNNDIDPSTDLFQYSTLPLLRKFGLEEGLAFKIKQRGFQPGGGGIIEFTCKPLKTNAGLIPAIAGNLIAVDLLEQSLVKRIRGVVVSAKISPQTANRAVRAARGVLNDYIPDVYIFTNVCKGKESGASPGISVSLTAESENGNLVSIDCNGTPGLLPEDLGMKSAKLLLQEVEHGGSIDSTNQSFLFLLMAMCTDQASRARVGKITSYSVGILRLIKTFLGVVFKIKADHETRTVVLSCMGKGVKNFSRSTT